MPQKKCDKCGETAQAHELPLKHGVFRIVNGQFKMEECSGTFKEVGT